MIRHERAASQPLKRLYKFLNRAKSPFYIDLLDGPFMRNIFLPELHPHKHRHIQMTPTNAKFARPRQTKCLLQNPNGAELPDSVEVMLGYQCNGKQGDPDKLSRPRCSKDCEACIEKYRSSVQSKAPFDREFYQVYAGLLLVPGSPTRQTFVIAALLRLFTKTLYSAFDSHKKSAAMSIKTHSHQSEKNTHKSSVCVSISFLVKLEAY